MTVKIQRQDGVVIEVEGSADDLVKVLPVLVPLQWNFPVYGGTTTLKFDGITGPCLHEYPGSWYGSKPTCIKCGKEMQ